MFELYSLTFGTDRCIQIDWMQHNSCSSRISLFTKVFVHNPLKYSCTTHGVCPTNSHFHGNSSLIPYISVQAFGTGRIVYFATCNSHFITHFSPTWIPTLKLTTLCCPRNSLYFFLRSWLHFSGFLCNLWRTLWTNASCILIPCTFHSLQSPPHLWILTIHLVMLAVRVLVSLPKRRSMAQVYLKWMQLTSCPSQISRLTKVSAHDLLRLCPLHKSCW